MSTGRPRRGSRVISGLASAFTGPPKSARTTRGDRAHGILKTRTIVVLPYLEVFLRLMVCQRTFTPAPLLQGKREKSTPLPFKHSPLTFPLFGRKEWEYFPQFF